VPPAMWPWITAAPRCTLIGPGGMHTGDHRARHSISQVGKMNFRWAGAKRRPEVALPTPTADHINPANGVLR
jgi:hypothetical protein